MKNIILVSFFLCLGFEIQAQVDLNFLNAPYMHSTGSRIEINNDGDTILVTEHLSTRRDWAISNGGDLIRQYRGTPYFMNKWHLGQIETNENEILAGILAYDVIYNIVQFTPNEETFAVSIQPQSFKISDKEFRRLEDREDGESNPFYYSEILNGEFKLLERYSGRYIQTIKPVDFAYGKADQIDYMGSYQQETFYYLLKDENLIKVSNKASFYRKLGAYAMQAKKIIKEENLDMEKVSDIKKFTAILNSIFSL